MTLACSPSLSLLQDVQFMTQAFRRQLICHLVAKEKKEKKGGGCKKFFGGEGVPNKTKNEKNISSWRHVYNFLILHLKQL